MKATDNGYCKKAMVKSVLQDRDTWLFVLSSKGCDPAGPSLVQHVVKGGAAGANLTCSQNHHAAQLSHGVVFPRVPCSCYICKNPPWAGFRCTCAVDKGQKETGTSVQEAS